ncbi:thiamine phosphate synthase [Jeotgalibacillus sp. JSM ZJ347]|uniref:thiamine phosphate synthase n=1 Tax=Jeotgalibacillus sp. JSM ZJ347 TaxID=3342117 RepID=UPI0035A962DD
MFTKPAVYLIFGTPNTGQMDPLLLLEEALKGGISYFQLREKGPGALTGQPLKEFALKCQALCRLYHVPFIINDHVDLACEISADGIHVGQEDTCAQTVRAKIGHKMFLGVSVHSLEEAEHAVEDGADYLGMGPIYGTKSKPDAKEPSGVAKIIRVKNEFPYIPVVGIGGITASNAGSVWEAGAEGIAVISAVTEAENVQQEVKRLTASYRRENV